MIMQLIGNILWFVFGGLLNALAWLISGALWCLSIVGIPYGLQCFKFARLAIGALWCITIVGIPFGMQFFKLAKLSFMPFGAEIREIPE